MQDSMPAAPAPPGTECQPSVIGTGNGQPGGKAQTGQGSYQEPVLGFKVPGDFERFRSILTEVGYTDRGILDALGVGNFPSIRAGDEALLLWRTRGGTALENLIRLFLMLVPVDLELARRAFEPMKIDALVEAGLVRKAGDMAVANIKLLPYQSFIFAFDPPQRLASGAAHDYVMGIGQSSITLATLTVRKPCRQVLDLGTGCGIQALLAARHSQRVLAVDRNPHAVRLAFFNARLNGMDHVECLEGDLFEPVPDQRFDLVVANPPFVISPDNRYIYRDSGMPGDQICQSIVQQVPRFLEEGGYAQVLCNWVEPSDQDWRERLSSWFDGSGCDAWVIRSERRDAALYASTWIRHTEAFNPAEQGTLFDEWMRYYQELGIEAMSAGLITMRRRSCASNWYRADDAPEKMIGPCGDSVAMGFDLTDFLEAHKDDSALLDSRLRVSSDVRLEQTWAASIEQWQEVAAQLYLARGFAFAGNVDSLVAQLVLRSDGRRRLGDLLAELAVALETDLNGVVAGACSIVRQLVQRGFLLPLHIGPVTP